MIRFIASNSDQFLDMIMTTATTTFQIYNNEASKYDQRSAPMDRMLKKYRRIFSHLRGQILEVGTGTGENLQYYSDRAQVIATDWSPNMIKVAKQKIQRQHLYAIKTVEVRDVGKMSRYYPQQRFNNITSTCVFCSVPDPVRGLQELKKILNPHGLLVQIEHGLSKFWLVNILMKFFDPLIARFGGPHIARNQKANLQKGGFQVIWEKAIDPLGIMRIYISQIKK